MVEGQQGNMAKMKTEKHDAIVLSSESEKDIQAALYKQFRLSPLPADEMLPNLGLFLTSKSLSRVLFYYEIYRKILNTHGVIIEFGVRWGQTLALMSAMRGIFEAWGPKTVTVASLWTARSRSAKIMKFTWRNC
jgi:hypothetical protein